MATYQPPTETLPIFDPNVFISNNTSLTPATADLRYLRFPYAQGTENLQVINVDGVATFGTDVVLEDGANSSTIVQTGTNLSITAAPTSTITLDGLTISAGAPASNTPIFQIEDTLNSNQFYFLTNIPAGAYNPINAAGDCCILGKNSSPDTESITLTAWSTTESGVRITPTTTTIVGGVSYVSCNGTSVAVAPSITFPDATVQTTAYTGTTPPLVPDPAGTYTSPSSVVVNSSGQVTSAVSGTTYTLPSPAPTAGTYTNATVTVNSAGQVTSASNGSAGTSPFVPIFHNFSDVQFTSTGYSQGPYINWSGGWGPLDFAIIRVTAQINGGTTTSQWNNYDATKGELILRPYYAPAGVIGSLNNPNIGWSTNSGSVCGSIERLMYYTGAVNNGNQDWFFAYGDGGSGGGSAGNIQLMAYYIFAGWEYTCTYEYIVRSNSGGSITFANGFGGGTIPPTNNILP